MWRVVLQRVSRRSRSPEEEEEGGLTQRVLDSSWGLPAGARTGEGIHCLEVAET